MKPHDMADWRKLRQQRPELFQKVVVWQQPAAVVDHVLCSWANESKEAEQPVPQQVGETEKPEDKQPAAVVDPVLSRWANESKEAEQPAHRTEEKRPDRSMAEWMEPRQKRPEIFPKVVVSHQPGSNTSSFQPLDPVLSRWAKDSKERWAKESKEAEQPADRPKEKRTRNWRVRPEVYEYGYSLSERW